MSFLDKLNALIDPKLKDTFERKAYDPAKDRGWVITRLNTTKTQFNSTETGRGGGAKWWKLSNGVVAFSAVRPDRQPLVINGQTTVFIPSEHFLTFVDHMIAAVNAGDFDKELQADTTTGTTVKVKTPTTRKTSTGDGSGWSAERRAAFSESIRRRNAAKTA